MKIIKIITVIFLCLVISSCTPARITKDDYPRDAKMSKVIVNRADSLVFVGIPAIFGYNEQDKVILWKNDVKELDVPVGKQEFFVRSNQADDPFKSIIYVEENQPLCITVHPEPKPIIKFIIPLVYYFSHAFKIEKSEFCK
jgi:hypothetical protein